MLYSSVFGIFLVFFYLLQAYFCKYFFHIFLFLFFSSLDNSFYLFLDCSCNLSCYFQSIILLVLITFFYFLYNKYFKYSSFIYKKKIIIAYFFIQIKILHYVYDIISTRVLKMNSAIISFNRSNCNIIKVCCPLH